MVANRTQTVQKVGLKPLQASPRNGPNNRCVCLLTSSYEAPNQTGVGIGRQRHAFWYRSPYVIKLLLSGAPLLQLPIVGKSLRRKTLKVLSLRAQLGPQRMKQCTIRKRPFTKRSKRQRTLGLRRHERAMYRRFTPAPTACAASGRME